MTRKDVRRSGAAASLAVLLALAGLPSEAMAQDRGQGRWGGRGDAAAQSQPRPEWRGNRGARVDNGQAQRIQQGQRAQARTAAPQQRARPESNSSWRARGADGETVRSVRTERQADWQARRNDSVAARRPNTPQANAVRTERPAEARPNPAWSNNRNAAEIRRNRPDGDRDRAAAARRDNDRDRSAVVRRDNDRNGWRNNDRRDTPNRIERARVQSPRWDDDRRWSYRNGRYDWNRDWRSDKRYDWHKHRQTYRYVYRPGPYYAPYSSYYYRPLLVGNYLGSSFYGSSYWLSDPWEYRLPQAYGPYRWVRYFDDVLLVNIHTGMVVDVIRNFFW